MPIDSPAADPSTSSLATPVLHVSAYVDRPLGVVLAGFAPPAADRLLSAAFGAAVDDVEVEATVSEPVWVSRSHVRVPVAWRLSRAAAAVSTGAATISLLVVQSGEDAITELLLVAPVPPHGELRSAAELHLVLDELARHLEAAA